MKWILIVLIILLVLLIILGLVYYPLITIRALSIIGKGIYKSCKFITKSVYRGTKSLVNKGVKIYKNKRDNKRNNKYSVTKDDSELFKQSNEWNNLS